MLRAALSLSTVLQTTGGTAVFGDLMFAGRAERALMLESYRGSGRSELADEIAGEFSWEVEMALKELRSVGFAPEVERFSELSGGIVAQKPVRSPSR